MKKYIYFLLIGFLMFTRQLLSQSLESSVISSTGSLYHGPSLSVSSTVGESVTTTLNSRENKLTQGFQQPRGNGVVTSVAINELFSEKLLYPNPANHEVYITLPPDLKDQTIEIFNYSGVRIKELHLNSEQSVIDVSQFGKGMYFIRTSNSTYSAKFIKR